MKQKKVGYILGGVFVLAIIAYFIFSRSGKSEQITVRVKKGTFPIEVTTTGELFAKSSEKIRGPQGLPQMQIYSVKILKLVQEGTRVDSGAFVAALDQSEMTSKMKEVETNRDKALTQLTQRQLDSSLNLRRLRDEQINLRYDLEQKKTIKEQSIYEPPATRRQAEIEVEKAERGLEQAQKSYDLQYRKEVANMDDANSTYTQAQRKLEQMQDKIKQFTIFAPKKGMVIYTRNWNGRQQEGSTVDTWGDFTVAELPDLSKMISRTYVNEIDISKIKRGQEVRIGIDAFPDKKFTGQVTEVANVGEQLPNSNAKVFEVNILINEFDSILKPSMTSKNTIVTTSIQNVIFAPIEAVFSNDSISYVFKKDGGSIRRQQVIAGQSNDNEIILKAGVKENDELILIPPENADKMKLVQLSPADLKKYQEPPALKKKVLPDPNKTGKNTKSAASR
jgi:HlyD family secretion protein